MPRGNDWASILLGALAGGSQGASQGLQQQNTRRRAEDEQTWRLGEPARQMDQFKQQADYQQGLAVENEQRRSGLAASTAATAKIARKNHLIKLGLPDDEADAYAEDDATYRSAIQAKQTPKPPAKDVELRNRIGALTAGGMPLVKASEQARLEFGEQNATTPADHYTTATIGGGTDQPAQVVSVNTRTGQRGSTIGDAKPQSTGTANQSLRSLSQVFAAGSGIGAVKEMAATHPNLKAFEERFLDPALPPASLTALDRFRGRLAEDIKTHGYISSAVASEAERELAAGNPDLVVYGRNLKQWVAGDLNVSKSSTDERQRLDMAVSGLSVPLSSMPPAQRQEFIHQMWEARESRLAGLQTAANTAQKMLDDRTGQSKGAPAPSSPNLGPSVGTAGQTVKPTISKMEAAQMRAMGASQAAIEAKYTIRP